MKKSSKFALAVLALGLVPLELNSGKDGTFSYQSLLVGITGRKKEDGSRDLDLTLFNLSHFMKKEPVEQTAEAQTKETPEASAEMASTEVSNASEEKSEIPVEPAQ